MPWRCPACQLQIHHSETEPRPRPGVLYRCHVCRQELVFDPKLNRLTIPPKDNDPSKSKAA